MKSKDVQGIVPARIGNSGITGKELVSFENNVDFAVYEITMQAGESIFLVPAFGKEYNHIYYMFLGSATAEISTGDIAELDAHVVLSLTGDMQGKLIAKEKVRLFSVYVKQSSENDTSNPAKPLVRTLKEIVGTARDIDFGYGHSRRFLVKGDGFNISIHNTTVYLNTSIPLEYKNHIEAVYYIRGQGKYTWNNGEEEHGFTIDDASGDEGTLFLMDNNDAHHVETKGVESEALCVFYPALEGTENHKFDEEGASSSY